jgi:hypothetical protein
MLVSHHKFSDVYVGHLKDQAKARPFLKKSSNRDENDQERWDRPHPNTITIKPYRNKVFSDPSAGKSDLTAVGRHRLVRFN